MRGAGAMRWAVAAGWVALLFAVPARAIAAQGLVTGFVDGGNFYESADPGVRSTWFNRTVDSGARIVRLHVIWANVAGTTPPPDPTNPGSNSYDFSASDRAVRDAEARGLSVMLTVTGAPSWAEGPGRPSSASSGTWRPSPAGFAEFVGAVAARYSGGFDPDGVGPAPLLPSVQALQLWNEPNLSDHLTPQYDGTNPASPDIYRDLLNAGYAAVKAVDPKMLVVTGGTAPYGDPPGGNRVRPVDFWKQVLCASPGKQKRKPKKRNAAVAQSCPGRAMFDVLAHHPINTSGSPRRHAINPADSSSADLDRIERVLRAAERAGTVLPGRHPLWATEMWWDSDPPTSPGSPPGRQARWIEDALYQAWKDGASVVINLAIRDFTTSGLQAGTGSGIFFADGRPKPSFTAFRFPFVTDRVNRGVVRAWGKAPAAGRLLIQRKRGKRWTAVRKLRVRRGQVFLTKLRIAGRNRLRAVVAGNRSLIWTQR
jgi:hypothetical protein